MRVPTNEFTCVNFPPSRPWRRTKNKKVKQSKSFQLYFQLIEHSKSSRVASVDDLQFSQFQGGEKQKKSVDFHSSFDPFTQRWQESSVGWTANELLQIFNFCFPPISIHFTFSSNIKKPNIGKSSNFSLSKWENITFEGGSGGVWTSHKQLGRTCRQK